MFEQIVAWHNLVLTVAAAAAPGATPVFATGAVAAVVLVAACLAFVAVTRLARRQEAHPGAPHPRRAMDVSAPLLQSDPDAPGHPRPRAPQVVAAA